MSKRYKKFHKHIDNKIILRARIYALVFLVMLVLLCRDVFTGVSTFSWIFGSLIVGILLGTLASRMFHLSWSKDSKKIIARLDSLGIVILIFYILFSLFRSDLVKVFVHGPMVGSVSMSLIAGSFFGQLLGMRDGIKGILRAEGIIS